MTTKDGDLLRGGAPIVCLAHRNAFQQEADRLAALADPGGPAPRISIRIVPDPSAERPPSTGAPEPPGKHGEERG